MINAKVDPNGISQPPGTVVGYRSDGRPIYNIAGGAIEIEPDDDDDPDNSVDDDDDDDDDPEDSWTPPSKDAWEKLVAEKKKADSESAQRKRLLRDAGINPKTGEPLKTTPRLSVGDDDDDSTKEVEPKADSKRTVDTSEDAKALQKRLQREMERNLLDQEKEVRNEERGRAKALISAIPTALQEEGWNGKAMPRILKLLDLDSVEVDEDGVAGLDEQIQELKADFPEFFKRTRMKEAAEKVADRRTAGGGTKKTSPVKQDGTWAENIARALHDGG